LNSSIYVKEFNPKKYAKNNENNCSNLCDKKGNHLMVTHVTAEELKTDHGLDFYENLT
jgi:hypothetical protein